MGVKICLSILRARWNRIIPILFGCTILFCSSGAWADPENGRITKDIMVGGAHDVPLKANQPVKVLKHSGETVVIMVALPDGSSGIYQIDAAAVEILASTAAPPTVVKVPAVTNTAQISPVAPEPTAPAPSLAKIAPAPATAAGDPSLPEDKSTLIHVNWPEDSKLPPPFEDFDKAKEGSYSYRLYLPPGYYEHPNFHYPTLFIMSPSGNAELGSFYQRARTEGWIVVMFVEARNGDWGPIYGDMLATHADVVPKVRIQDGLKFATGFSGGARGTSVMSQFCPGFDGELLQGAGFALDDGYHLEGIPRDHPYAVFMAMGSNDSNAYEVASLKEQLHGVPFKSQTFQGGHMEAPTSVCNEGLDWLMEQALTGDSMTDDLRACGARQFIFLTQRWESETDSAKKAEKAVALATLGDSLNLPSNSPEFLELKKIKDSLPLEP